MPLNFVSSPWKKNRTTISPPSTKSSKRKWFRESDKIYPASWEQLGWEGLVSYQNRPWYILNCRDNRASRPSKLRRRRLPPEKPSLRDWQRRERRRSAKRPTVSNCRRSPEHSARCSKSSRPLIRLPRTWTSWPVPSVLQGLAAAGYWSCPRLPWDLNWPGLTGSYFRRTIAGPKCLARKAECRASWQKTPSTRE